MKDNQSEKIRENHDLVKRVLSDLGDDFCVTIGRRIRPTDGDYFVMPTYNIRKKGLFGSSHRLLGARTVLQLCGHGYDTAAPFGAFYLNIDPVEGPNETWHIGSGRGEPTELSHYVANREPVPESVRKMLQERKLPEWSKYS